jgi:hypothetical protein
MMLPHPLAWGETGQQGLGQASGMPRVDIFDAGRLPACGLAPARGQPPGVPCRQLAVDQEPATVLTAERGAGRHLELLNPGVRPTRPLPGLEFVACGLRAPEGAPLSSSE